MTLNDLINAEGATLIDVREPWELQEGYVPGAENIPLGQLMGQIDAFRNMPKPLILFCRSGNRSGMAAAILKAQGVTEVYNGGTWQDVYAAKAAEV